MSVRDLDKGYKELIKRMYAAGKPKIAVGIFEADGQVPAGDGITLIEIAAINEFGGGDVPSRSFIRAWVDENPDRSKKALMAILQQCLKTDGDVNKATETFALWMQGEIQKRIATGIPPANAPGTIAKKGSSKPLINTGQLRSSITYAIDWGNGTLKVHKSEAAKKREKDSKAAAREQRKADKRKTAQRRKARKKAARELKKSLRKALKSARRDVMRGARGAKKSGKSLIRTTLRTSSKFLRNTKRIIRAKRRKG